jgi:hypothetical protein
MSSRESRNGPQIFDRQFALGVAQLIFIRRDITKVHAREAVTNNSLSIFIGQENRPEALSAAITAP